MIGDAFLYVWFFVEMLFLFRPYQLKGVKRKLILVVFVLFCVDAVYRVVLQVFVISHSQLSVTQKIPLNIMSLSSICWKSLSSDKSLQDPVEESDLIYKIDNVLQLYFLYWHLCSIVYLSNVQQTN